MKGVIKMEITKRQNEIIFSVINSIDLELTLNNEKAIAILNDYVDSLFGATEPNIYEYNYNYKHYNSVINVVFDYLIQQEEKISELNGLLSEYLEISQNSHFQRNKPQINPTKLLCKPR